jgi:hypothetical protein
MYVYLKGSVVTQYAMRMFSQYYGYKCYFQGPISLQYIRPQLNIALEFMLTVPSMCTRSVEGKCVLNFTPFFPWCESRKGGIITSWPEEETTCSVSNCDWDLYVEGQDVTVAYVTLCYWLSTGTHYLRLTTTASHKRTRISSTAKWHRAWNLWLMTETFIAASTARHVCVCRSSVWQAFVSSGSLVIWNDPLIRALTQTILSGLFGHLKHEYYLFLPRGKQSAPPLHNK